MRTSLAALLLLGCTASLASTSTAAFAHSPRSTTHQRTAGGSRRSVSSQHYNAARLPQVPFHSGARPLHTYHHAEGDALDTLAPPPQVNEHAPTLEALKDELSNEESSSSTGWVFLIRHGEKRRGGRPGLSVEGKRRAKCIRRIFSRGELRVDYALAQAYKKHGRRRRAYETLRPLARRTGIPLDTSCNRDDPVCVRKVVARETAKGNNVVVSWEHAALTPIARQLGIRGLWWDDSRFDIIFHIKNRKVYRIDSQECDGLDEEWVNWRGKRSRSGHGRGGDHGLMIDDDSWAEGAGTITDVDATSQSSPVKPERTPVAEDDEDDDLLDDDEDYDDADLDEDDEPNDLL